MLVLMIHFVVLVNLYDFVVDVVIVVMVAAAFVTSAVNAAARCFLFILLLLLCQSVCSYDKQFCFHAKSLFSLDFERI